jgi:hypothetical protein
MLKKLGIESQFSGGLRVTGEPTIEIVEMVLAGSINKSIVGSISTEDGHSRQREAARESSAPLDRAPRPCDDDGDDAVGEGLEAGLRKIAPRLGHLIVPHG